MLDSELARLLSVRDQTEQLRGAAILDVKQNTACCIMVLVLVFCIIVQYDDSDGWLWMTSMALV